MPKHQKDKAVKVKQNPEKHQPKPQQPKQQARPRRSKVLEQDTMVAVAQNRTTRSGRAKVTTTSDGVVFEHTEKFADVVEAISFSPTAFFINPGNASMFPWLSGQAHGYQEFIIEHLEVQYVAKAGSSTAGSVMMGCDYDVESPLPVNDVAMDAYIGTAEFAPWKNAVWRADAKSLKALSNQKYILQGYAVNDLKTYCPGNFIVAVMDGVGSTAKWGKLWVSYRIRLLTPQMTASGPSPRLTGGAVYGGGTVSAADCLGTAPTLDPQAVGLGLVNRNTSTTWNVQLPAPGQYMCVVILVGTGITGPAVSSYTNGVTVATVLNVVDGTATTSTTLKVLTAPSATSARLGQFWMVATATTVTACGVRIAPIPTGSINIVGGPKFEEESPRQILKRYMAAKNKTLG